MTNAFLPTPTDGWSIINTVSDDPLIESRRASFRTGWAISVGLTGESYNPAASLSALNGVASSAAATQTQIAAENAGLRILYGRVRIGAQVADVLTYNNALVMVLVWGEGEINAIESVTVGDVA